MPKIKLLNLYGLFCIFGALATLGTHRMVLGDTLLFHSDVFSLFIYTGGMAMILASIALAGTCILKVLSPNIRVKLEEFVYVLAVATCLAILIWLAISYVVNTWPQSIIAKAFLTVFYGSNLNFGPIPALLILLVSITMIWKRHDRAELLQRTRTISGFVAVILLVSVPLNSIYANFIRGAFTTDGPKHLVLMVLDAMPSQFIKTVNPAARKTSPIDEVFSKGLIYEQMHTSAPFTYAFFGTLYGGKLPYLGGHPTKKREPRNKQKENGNLLSTLQKNGVAARWMVYRRLGIPEGSATQDNRYSGLRSNILTSQFAWVPALFGVDYHLFLNTKRRKRIMPAVFPLGPTNENVFVEALLPQLEQVKRWHNQSFTIFHIRWNLGKYPKSLDVLSKALELDRKIFNKQTETRRYELKYDHIAKERRVRARRTMHQLGTRLKAFMKIARNSGALNNVSFMITADHGNIYSKGRYQYYIHPNEEVTRVPVVLLGAGKIGKDNRHFSTPDLTAGILDFFNIKQSLSPYATSILGTKRPRYAMSLTGKQETAPAFLKDREDNGKKWLLTIWQNNRKFSINIHPAGNGIVTEFLVKHYEEKVIRTSKVLPTVLQEAFHETLMRYQISEDYIHKNFRSK